MKKATRYDRIIEHLFASHYKPGVTEIRFHRDELVAAASKLQINLPKNLGDILYTYRYRSVLPDSIRSTAPEGYEWIIRPAGRSVYVFSLTRSALIVPSEYVLKTKIPDATPGIITMYALNDEQALLAKVRYNRLIDVFTGLTCYSLQNHLRTSIEEVGQIETDELYIGVDKQGVHYIIPVQAKGGRDYLSVVQIEQDKRMCANKYPNLVCRPIGTQFISKDLIALFEFVLSDGQVAVASEKHYRLVPPDDIDEEDLLNYRTLSTS